tara:strand:+ start:581 stop:1414 length:834 start_codon:yes stop_codon:yes gene_type:complete
MYLVTRNRLLIAFLLTIIFVILLWRSAIFIYLTQQEGYSNDTTTRFFVINMDKDKERYNNILKYYQNSDFSNEKLNRFSGINGKVIVPDNYLTSDALNELHLIEKNGYRTHHHSLTRGGIGCFLSHYYLAKELLKEKSNVDAYLIFEDDTRIFPNTYTQIKDSMKTVPDDWDIVLFYTIRAVGHSENKTFNKIKSFWGMNCYLINKNGAKKFVEEVDNIKLDGQVDCYLSRMIQQKKLHVYSTKKQFIACNSTDTNIQTLLKPQKGVDPFDYNGYKV